MAQIETVQQIYQAFGRGDVPAILDHLADDVDWECGPVSTDVPTARFGQWRLHSTSCATRSKRLMKRLLAALAPICVAFGCVTSPVDKVAAAVEVDHVYIYAPVSGPEDEVMKALASAGLALEAERKDFGDGVVGRYVRFENVYL